MAAGTNLDVDDIKSWRSIITLIVFVLTNLVVLFPFHIRFSLPIVLIRGTLNILRYLRVISPNLVNSGKTQTAQYGSLSKGEPQVFTRFGISWTEQKFPMNFITAPLIADLFLLAILAIGREEVYGGTVGSNNIQPINIMVFFLTLAYVAISIDASGLIRYLAFRVLKWGGKVGHRLFFYLYAFFFALGSFIGNDPIILSGTAFLAYMTRVSNNIQHPRAWIHTQFAVANISSAILVSSNPTNLVLSGAFNIKFIVYTANMIVPVVATAVVLFPCLLYIVFAHPNLIPLEITMHELSEEAKQRAPVNPNIPNARGTQEDWEATSNEAQGKLLSLEEIMNPFLDKKGAAFGAVIMTATLVTVLAVNAASQDTGEHPVFWVTLPAAFVMFCWDLALGWMNRRDTRDIARQGRAARVDRFMRQQEAEDPQLERQTDAELSSGEDIGRSLSKISEDKSYGKTGSKFDDKRAVELTEISRPKPYTEKDPDKTKIEEGDSGTPQGPQASQASTNSSHAHNADADRDIEATTNQHQDKAAVLGKPKEPKSLESLAGDLYRWCQETFPTATTVLTHLPFALVPFALCMFVLVEALVTKGWVPVFAYGWDHWVNKTGTVGAIGGMGFLSVILCNFAGTNIGTTILLSRVVQAWEEIHKQPNVSPISDRDFWATVYSMALGVNYGAFSTAFSASLAGLLWRDILARKHIKVRRLEFARVNLPIIAIAMTVGCAVLIGEVYIVRSGSKPYN